MATYTLTAAQLNNRILNSFSIPAALSTPTVSDSDAQAFINAAVITDITQANSVNTLVVGLKADGIWSKMKAIYPFVGGTATTHKYNLKDPRDLDAAFRLSFNGGWTHSANGALGNSVNTYADTFLNPVDSLSAASYNYSVYSRNQFNVDRAFMGAEEMYVDENSGSEVFSGTIGILLNNFSNRIEIIYAYEPFFPKLYASNNTIGFFNVNNDSGTISLYKNGAAQTLTGSSLAVDLPNISIALATVKRPQGFQLPAPVQLAFSTIGDKLTPTESLNLYNRIQTYQTALNRQI
jgi:hypothetical protein